MNSLPFIFIFLTIFSINFSQASFESRIPGIQQQVIETRKNLLILTKAVDGLSSNTAQRDKFAQEIRLLLQSPDSPSAQALHRYSTAGKEYWDVFKNEDSTYLIFERVTQKASELFQQDSAKFCNKFLEFDQESTCHSYLFNYLQYKLFDLWVGFYMDMEYRKKEFLPTRESYLQMFEEKLISDSPQFVASHWQKWTQQAYQNKGVLELTKEIQALKMDQKRRLASGRPILHCSLHAVKELRKERDALVQSLLTEKRASHRQLK